MSVTRMQWMAILLPAAVIFLFELLRHGLLEHLFPGHEGTFLGAVLVAAAVSVFIRYFVRQVTRVERALGRVQAEAAVLEERQRIGREMHDSVAQALFSLRIQLLELKERPGAPAELADLERQVLATYEQVRAVIADLRRQPDVASTAESLRSTAERVARELGLDLHLELSWLPECQEPIRGHLLSIVTEAMANAHRHGKARRVSITADRRALTIRDDGQGFDPAAVGEEGGFGLMIMDERARLLGGKLDVRSEPGRGTAVTLSWEVEQP